MRKGLVIAAIMFLLSFSLVFGATIHGKIFDYTFNLAPDSIVKINTLPEQQIVSKDGSYSFTVPKGDYVISAVLKDESGQITYSVDDNVSIVLEGDYVRDLIMFPSNDLGELDINQTDDDPVNPFGDDNPEAFKYVLTILIISIILVLGFVIWIVFAAHKRTMKEKLKQKLSERVDFLKKEKEENKQEKEEKNVLASRVDAAADAGEPDEIIKLSEFIKKNKRVTQKDIRKNFPVSEAKISLLLSDLESQGNIRKIKKGRGNIIIYEEKR